MDGSISGPLMGKELHEILASVHFNDDAGNSFMLLQLFAVAVPEMEGGTSHPPPPSIPFRLCVATLGRIRHQSGIDCAARIGRGKREEEMQLGQR